MKIFFLKRIVCLSALTLFASFNVLASTSSIYLGEHSATPGRTAIIGLQVLDKNLTYQVHCELKAADSENCGYVTAFTAYPDGSGRDYSHRIYIDGEEIVNKGGYFYFNPKGAYFEMNNVKLDHGHINIINMCWSGNISVSKCYARPW